jgi:uncharacterized protein (DUF608 family)
MSLRAHRSAESVVTRFPAAGYPRDVAGVVHHRTLQPTQGMPLGGVATGCTDLGTDGTWGFSTIYNSHVPRRGPINTPALALSTADATWVLSTRRFHGFDQPGMHAYRTSDQVRFADDIAYWGHYPAVDLEFDTDAPLDVSARFWSPFVPGDLDLSSSPVIIADINVDNPRDSEQSAVVVLSIPGPTGPEAGGALVGRAVEPGVTGEDVLTVTTAAGGYSVTVPSHPAEFGGSLGVDGAAWRRSALTLPSGVGEYDASVRVPVTVAPGARVTVTVVFAWHFPLWMASGNPDPAVFRATHGYSQRAADPAWTMPGGDDTFRHMYATRFADSRDVLDQFVPRLDDARDRVVAWQSAVYSDDELDDWLQDALVNSLHLIAETGLWAAAEGLVSWARPEDGVFGMNEDPRNCPQIECVPCSFYGNFPLVFFFPQLALSTLRAYQRYQFDNGEVTWIFGGVTASPGTAPIHMASPDRGYQTALNGSCVVDMVYRYWQVTGDSAALDELYPMVKSSTEFTMSMRLEDGIGASAISFPAGDSGLDWFEACSWAGMAAHLGGIRLAHLRQAEAIARAVGDDDFAQWCADRYRAGSVILSSEMWSGDTYVNYWDKSTGERSDLIMSSQLDGQWMTDLYGLPPAFDRQQAATALETVRHTCVDGHPFGVVNFADRTGRATTSGEGKPGWNYNPHAFFVPENLMLAAQFIAAGDRQTGLAIAERCWANLTRNGLTWDQPNLLDASTGQPIYGNDYYQNLIVWTLPATLAGVALGEVAEAPTVIRSVLDAARTQVASTA